MSDEERTTSGHGHATFLSGILVGILIALLFTTKRGRQLLKVISDEGIGKFNKWEDLLTLLEDQLAGSMRDEEPVMGEDLKEEVKEIKAPHSASSGQATKSEKKEVLRQAQDEKKFEEEDQEVEKALEDKRGDSSPDNPLRGVSPVDEKVESTIVEKIEEKVKEVEALADELREVKEAIVEKVEEAREEAREEAKAEETVEEDLPLHKAVEPEDPSASSGQENEEPKKKSRRLFKGIRRKS